MKAKKKKRMTGRYIVEVETPAEIHEVFKSNDLAEAAAECRSLRRIRKDARVYDTKLRKHVNLGVMR